MIVIGAENIEHGYMIIITIILIDIIIMIVIIGIGNNEWYCITQTHNGSERAS